MDKIIVYKSGERCFMHGMSLSLHNGEIEQEYDLNNASETEIEELRKDPYNDILIKEVVGRS